MVQLDPEITKLGRRPDSADTTHVFPDECHKILYGPVYDDPTAMIAPIWVCRVDGEWHVYSAHTDDILILHDGGDDD